MRCEKSCIYRGHVLVWTKHGLSVEALDCRDFVYDQFLTKLPDRGRLHGRDRVVLVGVFDAHKYSRKVLLSEDPAVNPAYQLVDQLVDNAQDFSEACQVLPILLLSVGITLPEDTTVRQTAVKFGIAPAEAARLMLMFAMTNRPQFEEYLQEIGYESQELHPRDVLREKAPKNPRKEVV